MKQKRKKLFKSSGFFDSYLILSFFMGEGGGVKTVFLNKAMPIEPRGKGLGKQKKSL